MMPPAEPVRHHDGALQEKPPTPQSRADGSQAQSEQQEERTAGYPGPPKPEVEEGTPRPPDEPSLANAPSSSSMSRRPSKRQDRELLGMTAFGWLSRHWREHVAVVVDTKSSRDHLALERTFLAYLRTSAALANLGVLVAQLFNLQHSDTGFGYSAVGKPMATVCLAGAIVTMVLGAARAWRYQRALLRGKALSGGAELTTIGAGVLAIIVVFFGLLIAIAAAKGSSGR